MTGLAVYSWPESKDLALHELATQGVTVISLKTLKGVSREIVRNDTRAMLSDFLCRAYACTPEKIKLLREPGKQPGLSISIPDHQITISLSHEQGLSVAAIGDGLWVGVDLLLVDPELEWQTVAELYLGKQRTIEIAKIPQPLQASCFARQWATLEAQLKCLGQPMSEWSPQREHKHAAAACYIQELNLPSGYAGMIAIRGYQQQASI
jgi:4'-phosphopantetheinyl transferase